MKLKTFRSRGFTLIEIMIVVAIIGLLAAVAIPNFVRARVNTQTNACINNLRQIDAAIQQWALENNVTPSSPVTGDDVAPYLPRGVVTGAGDIENRIYCPSDTSKKFSSSYANGLATVDDQPECVIGASFSNPHILP